VTGLFVLRANVEGPGGFAANCLGAAALSARVVLFAAGGFSPVSGSLRFAPPARVVVTMPVEGATRWEARRGSSTERAGANEKERGAGPRIEGLLRVGEIVVGDTMFGDFSARGILLGEAILEG
jgi:hypothetical protein